MQTETEGAIRSRRTHSDVSPAHPGRRLPLEKKTGMDREIAVESEMVYTLQGVREIGEYAESLVGPRTP